VIDENFWTVIVKFLGEKYGPRMITPELNESIIQFMGKIEELYKDSRYLACKCGHPKDWHSSGTCSQRTCTCQNYEPMGIC
jgi:HEPN domain-containing protein